MEREQYRPDWQAILLSLIKEPGTIAACYTAFHRYSLRNRALAAWQLKSAGIPLGPIATFKGWLNKGRCVQKGQKAIVLCVPIITKGKKDAQGVVDPDGIRRFFTYRKGWFAVAQTAVLEGAEVTASEEPEVPKAVWNEEQALAALEARRP